MSIESVAAVAFESPVSSGDPRVRWHRHEIVLGAMCLVLALGVRWSAADHDLSFDEIWILAGSTGYGSTCAEILTDELVVTPISVTAWENARSPLEVWTRGVTFHPPMHMFSLWWWRAVFGGSDWIAAMYSAIWSVVSIGFVFSALRMQAGIGPALCVALTMALSPVQSQLGTDIRGYGMVLGLVACAAWQMVRIECLGPTKLRVWLLGLTLCPLQLTHYLAAAACLSVCIWGLLRLARPFLWHLIAAVGCAALVCIVTWLPFAMAHIQRIETTELYKTQMPFWRGAGPAALSLILRLLFIVTPGHRGLWAGLLAIVLLLVLAGVWRSRLVTIWALFLASPLALLMALDFARGTTQASLVRYAAAASIGAAATPILSAFLLRKSLGWIVGAVFVGLTLIGHGGPRNVGSPTYAHMRRAVLPIINAESPDLPVVTLRTTGPRGFLGIAMFLELGHSPGFFPRPIMLVENATPQALQQLAEATPAHRFWLLSHSQAGAITTLPESVQRLFPTVKVVRSPVHVPAGHQGVQPEFSVDLWLLELGEVTVDPDLKSTH